MFYMVKDRNACENILKDLKEAIELNIAEKTQDILNCSKDFKDVFIIFRLYRYRLDDRKQIIDLKKY